MTSDRPFVRHRAGRRRGAEIVRQAEQQFGPFVVKAFRDCEPKLPAPSRRFAAVA